MLESAASDQQQTIIEKVSSYFAPDLEYTEDFAIIEVKRLLKRKAKHLLVVFKRPKGYLLSPS